VIGEGEAFHRMSPDGDRGEKADLHSPALTMITRFVTLTVSWRLLRISQYAMHSLMQHAAVASVT
jgi:hypothetical protein